MNTNRTFYISSQNGSDANPGDAPDRAFRSLARVRDINFQPGDQLLLERGSVFQGEALHLTARGTADAPHSGGCLRRGTAAGDSCGGKRTVVSELWRPSG